MAFIQKTTPPANKIMTFNLRSFTGGLNNFSEQLLDNQASSILNMMFADETVMEKRYGQKYFDEVVLDSEVTFLDEYKPYNDVDKLVRATNSKLYIGGTLVKEIEGKPCGINHQGRYFFVDGKKLYVYGKFAQADSTYVNVIGTPVDEYRVMQVVSPTNGHPRLGTEHTQGVININYDTNAIYYEPCENEFVDTSNGANVLPENPSLLVSHDGRMFVSGSDKDNDNVFITAVNNPYYFPVTMPLRVPPNSDKIVGLHVYDDSVIVGRQHDIYSILGKTNNPQLGFEMFQIRKINSHTGFANHNAVDIVHNYMFFVGNDGVMYSLASSRNDEKVVSTSVLSQTIVLNKTPIDITLDDVKTACSIFYNDEWYISIKDKVLVYSYKHRAWTMFNRLDAKCFYRLGNELIWGRANGRTYQFDREVFLDNDVPYEAHWYSKQFDMSDPNTYKQFREFYVVAHTFKDYLSEVNLVFEIDYSDVKDRLTVSDQISVYGTAKWGDRFITRNINESIPFIIGKRGRNIRFKIYNGHFTHGSVTTFDELHDYLGRMEGVFVYVTSENKYYLYTKGEWVLQTYEMLNQRMKVYQVNGDYELRGKR